MNRTQQQSLFDLQKIGCMIMVDDKKVILKMNDSGMVTFRTGIKFQRRGPNVYGNVSSCKSHSLDNINPSRVKVYQRYNWKAKPDETQAYWR